MTFLNALIWPILAIALIPLAVHIINKKRPAEKRFAAFDFLLKVDKITRKRIRFQSLLLFIIRTLILLLAAAAALQPVINSGFWKEKRKSGRIAAIVDPSLSMRIKAGSENGFRAGLTFVGNHAQREGVKEIVLFVSGRETVRIKLNGYAGEFAEKSAGIEPGFTSGAMLPSIKEALKLVLSGEKVDRLFIVSDFCDHAWSDLSDSLFAPFNIPVVLCNTADSLSVNRGITSLAVEERSDGVGVRVGITNSSPVPLTDWPVSLFLGEKPVMNAFITQDGGADISRLLLLSGYDKTEPGFVKQESDSLGEDDLRYFVYKPQRSVKMLIVDGDQSAHFTDAESYYFERAVSTDEMVSAKVISPGLLTESELNKHDLLCLLNYVPDDGLSKVITGRVENGMGLFVSLGNKVDAEQFNLHLTKATGALLREKKAGFGRDYAETEALALPVAQHQAVASMNELKDAGNYLFTNLFLLEPMVERNAETLLRLRSGDPLLLVRNHGKGRTALFLSTADMSWNNFPMRPFFVPFVKGISRYLSGREQINGGDSLFCGDSVTFASKGTMVLIDDPSGNRFTSPVQNGTALFYNTDLPGCYRLHDEGEVREFCVNVPPSESRLEPLGKDKLNSITAGSISAMVHVRYTEDAEVNLPKPIWYYLLFAVILLMIAEALIASGKRRELND
ncbi:MAG: BatA domain-containing protein [Fibrobacteres bacterium]|nr:BatA domain-containing protein [Fibrobacterota bacterium]